MKISVSAPPPEADAILRVFNAGLFLLDARGRIQSASRSALALTGRPASDLAGRSWWTLFGPAGHSPRAPDRAETEAVGFPSGHVTRLVPADGEERFLTWEFAPLDPGDGVLAAVRDVTRREKTARRLRTERAELLAGNRELSCLYGIAQWMGKAELTFGEILQRIVEFLPGAFPRPHRVAARLRLEDGEIYAGPDDLGSRPPSYRERIVTGGVMRGWLELVFLPEEGDAAAPPPALDPAERNLLRTVARQLGLLLERRDTETQRNALAAQLRHADRLAKVGQLAAGIAHELNTPLGAILGYAQLAAKTPALPETAARDMDRIVQSCLYAREIIRKLMLFSRQAPVRSQSLDLNELVEDTLSFLGHFYDGEGVTVRTAPAPSLPRIGADPGQLRQVLVNLVANGVQAMPGGGELTVATAADSAGVRLTVRDTGTGMPPEVRPRIFEPFFTTKPVDQGTGLGLSVVHGIAEAHGARIDVESEPGEGTAVHVLFPLAKREAN
jgi:PAS domain S-box-containing protein